MTHHESRRRFAGIVRFHDGRQHNCGPITSVWDALRNAALPSGADKSCSHGAIIIQANEMDAGLSAGRLAWQLSPLLASRGRRCRDNTCCVRDTCVTRLCGARRPAAAGWNLWVPAWRYRLCPPWFLTPACCRSDIRNLLDDSELDRYLGCRRPVRYAQIASLAACAVALLCLISWLAKLSLLVRLISDSILVGFKAGAGLTIIMTQLPALFGVDGGGHNFFDRAIRLAGQLVNVNSLVLLVGLCAILLLLLGERFLPGKPVGLTVVALSILVTTIFGLPSLGVPVTGQIPEGLPGFQLPAFGLLEPEELFPIAAGCLLLAYVEGVSAARSFATKHGYSLDVRQEFLGLGAANLAAALGHGYPVAGGLSQSAVNDSAGARTPLAVVFCSVTLSLCLLFFTGLLTNLPKAVLAATVFTAVYKLIDIRALVRMWQISRIDFYAAAIALGSVLLLGILQGVLLAAMASIFLLLARASRPNIAFLGRLPGTGRYSDSARHDGIEPLIGILAFRPEASLLYINADTILEAVLNALRKSSGIELVACDLSASPYIDLAGSRMLRNLHDELATRHVALRIVGAHGQLRDLLEADGLGEKTNSGDWLRTLDSVLGEKTSPN
jgi:SulP family sulfate permease